MYISETHSTSSLLRELYNENLPHLYTIRTDFQTAGRGQAGNSWESEKGKNLLFSSLLRYPEIDAADQWRISMLVAVAARQAIVEVMRRKGESLKIKWPNDIYYEDKKLVGILIENTLAGRKIAYTIAGVGINVNQTEWRSSAPNPLSLKQITGMEYDCNALLQSILAAIQKWETYTTDEIAQEYIHHLYRREGWHQYVEREVNITPTAIANEGEQAAFEAQWVGITNQGEYILRMADHSEKTYHFKQIRFIVKYENN